MRQPRRDSTRHLCNRCNLRIMLWVKGHAMKSVKLVLSGLILVFCVGRVSAQEPATSTTTIPAPSPVVEVSAAKRALIKEILDLTNSREASESMFSAQFDEMQKQMPNIMWESISSMIEFKRLTTAQQDEVRLKMNERSARAAQHIKELFLQRIDMKRMIEEISYVVYDKHFTEA